MEWITTPEAWIALATLTVLEIVLGIDNVVFIAIVAGRLPEEEQGKAWKVGLALACLTRLALLFSIVWIMRLTTPLFSVLGREISGRGLILLAGAFPPLESHAGDPSQPGGGKEGPDRALRMAEDFLGRAPADRGPGHHLLLGLGHHRGRNRRPGSCYGHRHYCGCRCDDAVG